MQSHLCVCNQVAFSAFCFLKSSSPGKLERGVAPLEKFFRHSFLFPSSLWRNKRRQQGRGKALEFSYWSQHTEKSIKIVWKNLVLSVHWIWTSLKIRLSTRTQRRSSPSCSLCFLKVKLTVCETSLRKSHNHSPSCPLTPAPSGTRRSEGPWQRSTEQLRLAQLMHSAVSMGGVKQERFFFPSLPMHLVYWQGQAVLFLVCLEIFT